MRNLGPSQLRLLGNLARPTAIWLTQDRTATSLLRRGLVREDNPDGAMCITPAGLRALADAMESGRVKDALERISRDG